MTGLLDLVRGAKRPERTVELCLRGDLVAEFEDLERRLSEINQRDLTSFAGSGDSAELADRMDEVRSQMVAGNVVFRLRSLGAVRSLTIVADHPPREDNDRDKGLGYNPDTFYRARIRECCYALEKPGETVLLRAEEDNEPTDAMSEEDWTRLFDNLSQQQFDNLFGAAWMLDHNDVSVPTSALAYLISQRNGESSSQPSAGESRRNGSQGGNPSGSPKSSTTPKDDSFA